MAFENTRKRWNTFKKLFKFGEDLTLEAIDHAEDRGTAGVVGRDTFELAPDQELSHICDASNF